jgi:hypothetical protein
MGNNFFIENFFSKTKEEIVKFFLFLGPLNESYHQRIKSHFNRDSQPNERGDQPVVRRRRIYSKLNPNRIDSLKASNFQATSSTLYRDKGCF